MVTVVCRKTTPIIKLIKNNRKKCAKTNLSMALKTKQNKKALLLYSHVSSYKVHKKKNIIQFKHESHTPYKNKKRGRHLSTNVLGIAK